MIPASSAIRRSRATTSASAQPVAGVAGASRIIGASGGNHTVRADLGHRDRAVLGRRRQRSARKRWHDRARRWRPASRAGLSSISAMTAGLYHTCVILSRARFAAGRERQRAARKHGDDVGVLAGAGRRRQLHRRDGRLRSLAAHVRAAVCAGTVFCWGANFNGELGDSTLSALPARPLPVYVSGLSGVRRSERRLLSHLRSADGRFRGLLGGERRRPVWATAAI